MKAHDWRESYLWNSSLFCWECGERLHNWMSTDQWNQIHGSECKGDPNQFTATIRTEYSIRRADAQQTKAEEDS